MTSAPSHLLYLHGFRSSPRSFKALRLQAWLAANVPGLTWCCPQLPPSPHMAVQQAAQVLRAWPTGQYAIIGSSLGGFYATCLAEQHGCRAVILNPAVDPARGLAAHVGVQASFHDPEHHFEFRTEYLDELRRLAPARLTQPERYFAVIAKGDELLDWREMATRYAGSQQRLIDGSDHGLSDFDEHLPHILHFLQLAPGS